MENNYHNIHKISLFLRDKVFPSELGVPGEKEVFIYPCQFDQEMHFEPHFIRIRTKVE